MDFSTAAEVMNRFIAFVIALIANEIAQGYMARFQGDNTPELNGRLTFNPLPHMDPIGSVVLPLIGSMIGGFMFGYPKPMPINTSNMKNPKWSPVITALAGPALNLMLSTVAIAILFSIGTVADGNPMIAIYRVLQNMVMICAFWAIFQLIPLPPLAGSEVVSALLPYDLRQKYESIAPYSMIIFILLIFSGAFRILAWIAQIWIGLSTVFVQSILG
ncbi:MAG: site-2 protease family protein [Pseudobacteriovorax sp.]|nr:site-2 protease family protein [Pseudobacteriovorax sp.]